MKLQQAINQVVSWLVAHGFQPNNREWAGLVLLTILIAYILWNSQTRSGLLSVVEVATGRKLLALWTLYFVWVVMFVVVAKQADIWRPILTKDTFVWGISSGLILLASFTEATRINYFKEKATEIVSATVALEYFMNLSPFSFLTELILQIVLLVAIALPAGATTPREREIASKVKTWVLTIASVVVVLHTLQTFHVSEVLTDWERWVIKVIWPVLLGVWVLALTFPLSICAAYEEVFLRLEMYDNDGSDIWRAKLGIVLALGVRLKLIREAAKGGAITYDVAHTNSIGTAYKEAKRHK